MLAFVTGSNLVAALIDRGMGVRVLRRPTSSCTDAAYETLRALGPSGAYLNFVGDEGQARIRASFGEVNYGRPAKLNARLYPDNRFALNQNIEPATDT